MTLKHFRRNLSGINFHVEKAADHRKGRSQLVADVRDEIAPHVVDAPALRHVVRDDHHVAKVGRDHRHLELAPGIVLKRIVAGIVPGKKPPAEVLIRHRVEEARADRFRAKAEMLHRAFVDPFEPPVFAKNRDALREKREGLPIALVAVADALILLFVFLEERLPEAGRKKEDQHYRTRPDDRHGIRFKARIEKNGNDRNEKEGSGEHDPAPPQTLSSSYLLFGINRCLRRKSVGQGRKDVPCIVASRHD